MIVVIDVAVKVMTVRVVPMLAELVAMVPIEVYVPLEYLKKRTVHDGEALLESASAMDADQFPVANVPAPGAAVTQPCPSGVAGIAVAGVDDPPCDQTSAK